MITFAHRQSFWQRFHTAFPIGLIVSVLLLGASWFVKIKFTNPRLFGHMIEAFKEIGFIIAVVISIAIVVTAIIAWWKGRKQ